MGDVMELARARQAELESEITAREAEIAEMRNEIETLSTFIDIGTELVAHASGKPSTPKDEPSPAAKSDATQVDDIEDAFDPFDDEEDLGASVAQLHADRPRSRPISRPA